MLCWTFVYFVILIKATTTIGGTIVVPNESNDFFLIPNQENSFNKDAASTPEIPSYYSDYFHTSGESGISTDGQDSRENVLEKLLEVMGPMLFTLPIFLFLIPFAIPALPLTLLMDTIHPEHENHHETISPSQSFNLTAIIQSLSGIELFPNLNMTSTPSHNNTGKSTELENLSLFQSEKVNVPKNFTAVENKLKLPVMISRSSFNDQK